MYACICYSSFAVEAAAVHRIPILGESVICTCVGYMFVYIIYIVYASFMYIYVIDVCLYIYYVCTIYIICVCM